MQSSGLPLVKIGTVVLALVGFVSPVRAQSAKPKLVISHTASQFAPLDTWKAAVLAGDKSALSALYAVGPDVLTQTPKGKTADPNEEPAFWSGLREGGLTALNPEILERQTPQPGMTLLVLRLYLTFTSSGHSTDMVLEMSQLWVQTGANWLIARTQRSDPFPRPILTLPEPKVPKTDLYPDPAEAQKDLDSALAAAARDHKNVIVVFGANWCYDCHVLDAAFHSKQIAPIVAANYHVVHVNIGGYDQNTDLAKRLGVPLGKGVPALAVLDSKGDVLTSQQHGEFQSAVRIGPGDVTQFLEHWKPMAGK